MKLSPVFNDLNDPATFINHIQELIGKRNDVVPHVEILEKLKEEFEVLDFMLPAFPQVEKLRKELEQLPGKVNRPS